MKVAILLLGILMLSTGCSPVSSSVATSAAPVSASEGPVLISQGSVPAGVEYKVLGTVKADFPGGYDRVENLYPSLAAEAKKLGANAVVNAKGGRRVTWWSYAAAYVSGTAIKVEDTKSLSGSYY